MKKRHAELVALDKRHVWHPFTQMRDWQRDEPVIVERGEGNWLVDTRGRRYIDGVSSLWCNVHGHRVPEIDRAVRAQLGKIAHSTFLGLSNVPAVLLAKELVKIAPQGLTRVFYADSGSAAVEVALKMAFQYWKVKGQPRRRVFLKLANAYHGDTIGSVSVGGIGLFHGIFGPLLFKTLGVGVDARAEAVEAVLKKHRGEIAAMIVEPLVQGAAGMLVHPRGFLKRVRALTKKYGVLLIVDEVATGFGRTGTMFACEREGVSPDFLCVAKGLTAGYLPLSATLTTEKIYKAFLGEYAEFKAFFHGHTYTANPLACAAALANLEIFRKKRVIARLGAKIRLLARELDRIAAHPHVGEVRQAGFMAGIEIVRDKKTGRAYPLSEKRGARVGLAARKKGVMVRPLGNVVVLMPPLSITDAELKKLCRVIGESIEEVTRE